MARICVKSTFLALCAALAAFVPAAAPAGGSVAFAPRGSSLFVVDFSEDVVIDGESPGPEPE